MDHDTVMFYRFDNSYASITFTVPGMKEWSEEEWNVAAQEDLESYVTTPEQYYLDDCWPEEEGKNK